MTSFFTPTENTERKRPQPTDCQPQIPRNVGQDATTTKGSQV